MDVKGKGRMNTYIVHPNINQERDTYANMYGPMNTDSQPVVPSPMGKPEGIP